MPLTQLSLTKKPSIVFSCKKKQQRWLTSVCGRQCIISRSNCCSPKRCNVSVLNSFCQATSRQNKMIYRQIDKSSGYLATSSKAVLQKSLYTTSCVGTLGNKDQCRVTTKPSTRIPTNHTWMNIAANVQPLKPRCA